ncbi:NADH:flavin oxidoreductase/NADH oxidase [Dendrothele bispora CBS 962.96]|uniref:NADH:flavin oxidoreductase/NADH oxidase n=1 Tax=Dendrothele bispora (strain CBS 962.96) TaxID=1314807 RepID=A0A4S8MHJ9_DENBC|nr:NADH:flavin oxidoreductase/NADH oxidase [Dendrothele bispora CBS 962.96]
MSNSNLFKPVKIGGLNLNHRVVLAPLTRLRMTPTEAPVPELVKEYYTQRAGTPGTLLITEATAIALKAHGLSGAPGFWSDEQIHGWKEIVDAAHAKGSFIYLQIFAMGRLASRTVLQTRDPSFEVIGAGDIPLTGGDIPRPLRLEEIREYVELYAQAAKNAVEKAGFDGVELHGCNASLIEQFLQDVTNNRTDEYGGSVENRARFALEVVNAVSKAIGVEKTAIRLSPWSTYSEMGMKDPISTYTYLVERLRDLFPGLAYLGVIEPRAKGENFEERELNEGESNDFIREIWSPKPLIFAGGYTRETAIEKAGNENTLIAFGRHFIANPDLPIRLEKNLALNAYDRSTFYVGGPKGYTDYSFISS